MTTDPLAAKPPRRALLATVACGLLFAVPPWAKARNSKGPGKPKRPPLVSAVATTANADPAAFGSDLLIVNISVGIIDRRSTPPLKISFDDAVVVAAASAGEMRAEMIEGVRSRVTLELIGDVPNDRLAVLVL